MESRRVVLLTEGYKLGWLNFDYKNPLSRLRESYLLGEVEKHLVKELLVFQATVDASVVSASLANNRKLMEIPYKSVESYAQLALPYQYKKSKIEVIKPEQTDAWQAMLREKKEQLMKERENLLKEKEKQA